MNEPKNKKVYPEKSDEEDFKKPEISKKIKKGPKNKNDTSKRQLRKEDFSDYSSDDSLDDQKCLLMDKYVLFIANNFV